MKKKFEDNVAGEIPKTKSEEPALPWKVEEADLAGMDSREKDYSDLERGEPPFKTRPAVLVILLVAVFASALLILAGITMENDKIKAGISEKEKEAAELQVNLERAAAEKADMEKSASELEKRVSDLSAQKELYTAVLESLVKKEDIPPAGAPAPLTREDAQ